MPNETRMQKILNQMDEEADRAQVSALPRVIMQVTPEEILGRHPKLFENRNHPAKYLAQAVFSYFALPEIAIPSPTEKDVTKALTTSYVDKVAEHLAFTNLRICNSSRERDILEGLDWAVIVENMKEKGEKIRQYF